MVPSAEPLIKQSSVGATARALTGESWAWKLWRCCLWDSSRTLIQPFLPPVMSSCCRGATDSTVAPDSWQQKATGKQKRESEVERASNKTQKKCGSFLVGTKNVKKPAEIYFPKLFCIRRPNVCFKQLDLCKQVNIRSDDTGKHII